MSDLLNGPDSVDFNSGTPTLVAGRIRINGGNLIVHTTAGEVTIPLSSLLASNLNGEGASLIGVRNISGQFTASLIEAILSEVKAEVDGIVGSGFQAITPHTVFSVGTGGIGPTIFNLSGVLPAEATHAVFEGRTVTNGSASVGINWYGYKVRGEQDNARWNSVFENGGPGAADVTKTLVLPLHSGRQTKWDAGVDSGGSATLKVLGWLNIQGAGLTVPQFGY